ncbi:hypothetical protein [Nocardia pneumoniae]|uniref:hypothetical protein n=1 Tax=Nocardia pneumoniae TaxID=228601 RepID=UPI0012F641CC|nr:hypothetical protein [Nocardia pneumoniae]
MSEGSELTMDTGQYLARAGAGRRWGGGMSEGGELTMDTAERSLVAEASAGEGQA